MTTLIYINTHTHTQKTLKRPYPHDHVLLQVAIDEAVGAQLQVDLAIRSRHARDQQRKLTCFFRVEGLGRRSYGSGSAKRVFLAGLGVLGLCLCLCLCPCVYA
jgi:hypothetical protein